MVCYSESTWAGKCLRTIAEKLQYNEGVGTKYSGENLPMKRDILQGANYRYNFDRDLFVNRDARKAFSVEFVDDHPVDEIVRRISENTNGNGWTFYFNLPPSGSVKQELERILG